MSEEVIELFNGLLVDTFNVILKIEELTLNRQKFGKLSITEVHTIDAIGIDKKKTMSDIAAELKITTGTLTSCINNLEKKGYVVRERSESDRRVVYVRLTHSGNLVCKSHQLFHRNMVKEVTESLSEDQLEILEKTLINIKKFFEREIVKCSQ